MLDFKKVALSLCIVVVLFSCDNTSKPVDSQEKVTVLVSKLYNDFRFRNLIKHFDSTITVVGMYNLSKDSVAYYLSQANGIIISGGNDIQPSIYGKAFENDRCGKTDPRRDTLEIQLINHSISNNVPLLGICRGEQILNVSQGGSLIIDIPSDWPDSSVVHRIEGEYVEHLVKPVSNTFLSSLCDTLSGEVKSLHHQAVENIALGFKVSAYSPDSLPEAIELIDNSTHPFLLGVQWHPEKNGL